MRPQSLILSLLAGSFLLAAAAPARADWDDWQRREAREYRHHVWVEQQRRRERAWREHEWREHHRYDGPQAYGVAPWRYSGGAFTRY